MACCGKGTPKPPAPVRQLPNPPATPKKLPVSMGKNILPPAAPAGTFNPPGKYCDKCGWIVAVSKFADPVTGKIIEKRSCTNRKCIDY